MSGSALSAFPRGRAVLWSRISTEHVATDLARPYTAPEGRSLSRFELQARFVPTASVPIRASCSSHAKGADLPRLADTVVWPPARAVLLCVHFVAVLGPEFHRS